MSSLPPLLIRADASPTIGVGHVMRMLALAQRYQRLGGSVLMASASMVPWLEKRLLTAGLGYERLPCRPGSQADAIHTASLARELAAPWIVLDGYHFCEDFHQILKQNGGQLMVMDDMAHLELYAVDLLVNQNYGAEKLTYRTQPGTLQLIGTPYLLIREEFYHVDQKRRKPRPAVPQRILITFGGSDPENMGGRILKALDHVQRRLDVVIAAGSAMPELSTLQKNTHATRHNVQLKIDTAEMPILMAWADAAFSAAGSTIWELLLLRVPTAAVTVAPNQIATTKELAAQGWLTYLGDSQQLTPQQLVTQVVKFCQGPLKEPRCPIDINGGDRIISELLRYDF